MVQKIQILGLIALVGLFVLLPIGTGIVTITDIIAETSSSVLAIVIAIFIIPFAFKREK